jgi:predicted Zn finger-like uncharacterized protein
MKDALMTVSCPHCSSAWWLPARLLGPGGARVRCPACAHRFEVGTDESRPGPVARTVTAPPVDDAFSLLAARSGELIDAEARGRLFAEHGSDLLDAFDRFANAHPDADLEAFHRALSERTGLALPPPREPSPEPDA